MRRSAWLVVVVLAFAALAVPAAARTLRRPRPAQVHPRAFASCARLVGYARSHLAVTHGVAEPPVRPFEGPVSSPVNVTAPAAAAPTADGGANGATPSFSTTNNQEAGVDEPDIVKTDGSTIFAVSGTNLYAVATDQGTPRLVGSLSLGNSGYSAQLLLSGSRLIVISSSGAVFPLTAGGGAARPAAAILPGPYSYPGQTVVTEVDVHDPGAMKIARTMTIDGTFVDARQNGSTARLVISSPPPAIANPALRAKVSGWVPMRRFHSSLTGRRSVRPVAACNAIRRPVEFSGLGMLTILTMNLDKGMWATDSSALMADAQVVYGSPGSLYVATQKWLDPQTPLAQLPAETTVIDRFDVTNPDRTTFVSSGEVPGYLLNQFSLSELNGYLRVATTSRPIWWAGAAVPSPGGSQQPSQSYVTVLANSGGLLVPVGQVSGLGAGQKIYSVRFIGDTGYVVTFRQVDPLYVIDLSTPTAPRVSGQLELQGYSSYLHPVGSGLLLGVGQDVGSGNEPSGSQLELFDVSNASAPRLLARTSLGEGSSTEVQSDHHAFLFWPPTNLAVLPVQIYGGGPLAPAPAGSSSSGQTSQFVGAIGYRVDRSGIAEVGRVVHDSQSGGSTPPIRRSIVIGSRLFTLSDGGVMASSLDTLAPLAFAAFPQVASPGPVATATPSPARTGAHTGP